MRDGGMVLCVRTEEVSGLFSLDKGARVDRRAVWVGGLR